MADPDEEYADPYGDDFDEGSGDEVVAAAATPGKDVSEEEVAAVLGAAAGFEDDFVDQPLSMDPLSMDDMDDDKLLGDVAKLISAEKRAGREVNFQEEAEAAEAAKEAAAASASSSRSKPEEEEEEEDAYSDGFESPKKSPSLAPQFQAKTRDRRKSVRSERSKVATALHVGGVTISAVQARLMGVGDEAELMQQVGVILKKQKKAAPPTRKRLDLLSHPVTAKMAREAQKTQEFARPALSDEEKEEFFGATKKKLSAVEDETAKNPCTFKPNLHSKEKVLAMKRCGYDFASSNKKDGDDDGAFVNRLTMMERQRRAKMEAERGRQDYEYKLGKKECARCGAVQSYDEVVEKRKLCQNCGIEYKVRRPRDSKGLDAWLDSQQRWIADRDEHRVNQAKQRLDASKRQQIGGADSDAARLRQGDPYQRAMRAKIDAQAGPFLDRFYDDLTKRRARKDEAANKAASKDDALNFKPHMAGAKQCADFKLQKKEATPAPVYAAPQPPPDPAQVSKWEDDLEAYLKNLYSSRRSEAQAKKNKAAADKTAVKLKIKADRQKRHAATAKRARAKKNADDGPIDEAIFDKLLETR